MSQDSHRKAQIDGNLFLPGCLATIRPTNNYSSTTPLVPQTTNERKEGE